ncbi:hypothetical protein Tco_1059217 [Tanacetum coccineum]
MLLHTVLRLHLHLGQLGSISTSTTPIVEKTVKLERLILDRKFTLVDDEGKHLENVDSSGDHDGEDEVKVVDNEMASFLASEMVGYDTNSLLEQ